MFKEKTKNQKGIALAGALTMSVVVLITSGVLITVINSNTKDIVKAKLGEQALKLAHEGLEHQIHYISQKNKQFITDADGTKTPEISSFNLPRLTKSLITSPINSVLTSKITYTTPIVYPVSLPSFPPLPGLTPVTNSGTILSSLLGDPVTADNLSLYKASRGIIENGTTIGEIQVKAIVTEIGDPGNLQAIPRILPLHPGYDLIEVSSIGYIPTKAEAKIVRKVSTKIRRPKTVVTVLYPTYGISAYGAFDAGTNSDLNTRTCPTCPILRPADPATGRPADPGYLPVALFSRQNIDGTTNPYYGSAKAMGTVANGVTGIKASEGIVNNAPDQPELTPKYKESTTPCVPTPELISGVTRTAYGKTGSCTMASGIDVADNSVIYNTVTYNGSVSANKSIISGTTDAAVKADPNLLSKFVVNGNTVISGNSTPSNSHLLYITSGNLELKGAGTSSGFFYLTNPASQVKFSGGGATGQFFGAIITKGLVNITAHYEFTFDASLAALPILTLAQPTSFNANPEPLKIY